MNRLLIALLMLASCLLPGAVRAQDDKAPDKEVSAKPAAGAEDDAAPKSLAEQLQELEGEYRAAQNQWRQDAQAAAAEGKAVDMTSRPKPETFAPRFMEFARQHAGDFAADNALLWVMRNVEDEKLVIEAMAELSKQPRPGSLAIAYGTLGMKLSATSEQLLRKAIQASDDHEELGQAHFALARILKRVDQMSGMLADPERAAQFAEYYGEERVAWFKSKDAAANRSEIEKLFETIKQEYGDIAAGRGTLAEIAERELFEIRNLAVGCVVPEIEAEDVDGVAFKISDYRGKVILLDFWGDW